MSDNALPSIFCAVDTADFDQALNLASILQDAECGLKLGLQFFNAQGPQGVEKIIAATNKKLPVFLDLKYHDIPNTVAQAVRAVAPLDCAYINVHAAGGYEMMAAAQNAAQEEAVRLGVQPPRVLGVTILTSLNQQALTDIGYEGSIKERVIAMAQMTQKAGLAGIVCSAHEIKAIRNICGDDFALMVPGIRPASHVQGSDDQKRVMAPATALDAGATHLVIGRPITKADSPAKAVANIIAEINAS